MAWHGKGAAMQNMAQQRLSTARRGKGKALRKQAWMLKISMKEKYRKNTEDCMQGQKEAEKRQFGVFVSNVSVMQLRKSDYAQIKVARCLGIE
jgi:hypothetical protein